VLLALCSPSIALDEIKWGKSLSEAKTQAAKLGRPIVAFWSNGADLISGTQKVLAERGGAPARRNKPISEATHDWTL